MTGPTSFRNLPVATGPVSCSFGKAILSGCCTCSHMSSLGIAERETPVCTDASGHGDCRTLHELLSCNAAFSLKRIHDEPMTHAQEMKVQCGGLRGLQLALNQTDGACDVAVLVGSALRAYGKLEELPYSNIVQSVAAFKMRRRNDR